MAKNKEEVDLNNFDSLIGKNTILRGKLESTGLTRLEGKLIGDAELMGNLIIGEGSYLNGNVKAVNVDVYGTIEGNLDVEDCLILHETSVVCGDIEVNTLIIKKDASFEGSCKMKNKKGTLAQLTKTEKKLENV